MLKITEILSEKECYNKLRAMRWPDGQVRCPRCSLDSIHTIVQKEIKRQYRCTDCNRHFNDLTDTLFQSSNLSLKHWMRCLYLMGLNVSNRQISLELGVSEKTAQNMTGQIRDEIQKNRPETSLSGEVEFDEVYVVSGHKGHPESVKKKGESPVGAG